MKKGKTLQDFALELDRQNKAKKDYLANTQVLSMTYNDETDNHTITIPGISPLSVDNTAHSQIGQRLGIPAAYYHRMRTNHPDLLCQNIEGWFRRQPENRLMRTFNGRLRAYLSDKYRRIDNYEIAQTVLPIIGEIADAPGGSYEVTDTRMYIKAVNPRLEAEVTPGDIVQAGIVITNSETGQGSVNVQPLIYRLICSNGMVVNDASQKRYHIGRINESDDNYGIFRDETIEMDDRAFLMRVEDTVRAAFDQAMFDKFVGQLREAANTKIETLDVPKVVEMTAKTYGLSQGEGEGVLQHLIQGGDLSLYGLANAVTKYSKDVNSYDRATELEATGWRIAVMDRSTWHDINDLGDSI